MKTLTFTRTAVAAGAHRVRPACFEERSTLPVSAACLVANAVRETLAHLFSATARVRLLAPVVPDERAWACIAGGSLIFAVRGRVSDAAFVVRRSCASVIAAAALGETADERRALSVIENELLARMMRELGSSLAPVCGETVTAREAMQLSGFASYFELLIEEPFEARIGVALAREPQSGSTRLSPQAPSSQHSPLQLSGSRIGAVPIAVRVEIGHTFAPAGTILAMKPGDVLRLDSGIGEPATVHAGGSAIATADCGELGSRRAAIVR